MENEALIPAHGGYRHLKSFQVAQLAYDVTVRFCDRYIGKSSRTHDQMVQAARSGVQNIAEGSQASGTSKKTEMKLTSVARASLEELRLDYQDFLRQRGLPLWDRSDPRRLALITRRCRTADEVARWVVETRNGHNRLSGRCGHGPNGPDGPDGPCAATESIKSTGSIGSRSIESIESIESTRSTGAARSGCAEIAANAALTLIAVACSLLERQLAAQAAAFQKEGGFTERLYRTRTSSRKNP